MNLIYVKYYIKKLVNILNLLKLELSVIGLVKWNEKLLFYMIGFLDLMKNKMSFYIYFFLFVM